MTARMLQLRRRRDRAATRLNGLAIGRGRGRGCRGGPGFHVGIDPAGMNARRNNSIDLWVDRALAGRALAQQAAEGRLDMAGRTTEPIVKIEVAQGGIEIVLQ